MYIPSGTQRRHTPSPKQRPNSRSSCRLCLLFVVVPLLVVSLFLPFRTSSILGTLGGVELKSGGRVLNAECECAKKDETKEIERVLQESLKTIEASKGGRNLALEEELQNLRALEVKEHSEIEKLQEKITILEQRKSSDKAKTVEENVKQSQKSKQNSGDFPDDTLEPEYWWNITNKELIFKQGMFWIPEHPKPTLTISVLVYREKDSLLGAFESWKKAGLLQHADEIVIWFQELDDDKRTWLNDYKSECRGEIKIIGSPNNEALLAATHWAIGNSTMDMVLFLEKDWQAVEDAPTTLQRIQEGQNLLEYEVAHVIRYRHRTKPGNPLYCQEMFQGREKKILDQQKNLMCCVHHWLDDKTLDSQEYAPYIYRCPALPKLQNGHIAMFRDQKEWWCSRAEYCLWTNNPYMIRKEWWTRNYKPMVDVLVHRWDEWTEHQRALDIEYLFAWNPYYWNSRAWTIAVGEGIFSHVERAEHVEVDYKAIRAEADAQDREKERQLQEQQKAATSASSATSASTATSATSASTVSADSALEPFQKPDMPVFDLHKTPSDNEWLPKAKEKFEQCKLGKSRDSKRAENSAIKGDITLVTALLDLGRGGAENGMFKRDMTEYYQRFQRILDRGFPMVIYMPPQFQAHLRLDKTRHHIIDFSLEDLKKPEIFGPYWDRVQAIRTSELWTRQGVATGWLDKAPQAILPGYNPLVMSKPFLLQQAAHLNPFNTNFHLFLDAGHACGTELTPGEMSLFEEHMDSAVFATFWRYGTATEVHGMTDKAMHIYMGQQTDPLKIVRGGIFGGKSDYIDCFVEVYKVILKQTLDDGYMGTEENLFAILYQRFPGLFKAFDNDSRGVACDNCAAFAANLERYRKPKQRRALSSESLSSPERERGVQYYSTPLIVS